MRSYTNEELIEAVHPKIYQEMEVKKEELKQTKDTLEAFKNAEDESDIVKSVSAERKATRLENEIKALESEEMMLKERARDFLNAFYKVRNFKPIIAELNAIMEAVNKATNTQKSGHISYLGSFLSQLETSLHKFNGDVSFFENHVTKLEPEMTEFVKSVK